MKKDPKTLSSGILFSGSEYGRELPIFEVLERIANLPLGMVTNEAVVLEDDTNKKFICFINAFDVAEKGETI